MLGLVRPGPTQVVTALAGKTKSKTHLATGSPGEGYPPVGKGLLQPNLGSSGEGHPPPLQACGESYPPASLYVTEGVALAPPPRRGGYPSPPNTPVNEPRFTWREPDV